MRRNGADAAAMFPDNERHAEDNKRSKLSQLNDFLVVRRQATHKNGFPFLKGDPIKSVQMKFRPSSVRDAIKESVTITTTTPNAIPSCSRVSASRISGRFRSDPILQTRETTKILRVYAHIFSLFPWRASSGRRKRAGPSRAVRRGGVVKSKREKGRIV